MIWSQSRKISERIWYLKNVQRSSRCFSEPFFCTVIPLHIAPASAFIRRVRRRGLEVATIVFVGFLVAILLDIDRETHEYLFAARAYTRTYNLTHSRGKLTSCRFASSFVASLRGRRLSWKWRRDLYHLSSIVNIKKIFLFFWTYVSMCVFSYLFVQIDIERYL